MREFLELVGAVLFGAALAVGGMWVAVHGLRGCGALIAHAVRGGGVL